MKTKIDIRQLSLEELTAKIKALGEKKFRAKQVHEWLWKKRAIDFSQMTNLSKSLRNLLEENFIINGILLKEAQKSKDKTIKNAFLLSDQSVIEGVLIPTKKRMTACVSVQVGCSLDCAFCATGKLKRVRNLNADEIYDQVVMINEQSINEYEIPISNIVYMGMGEPLLNYNSVIKSIDKITSPDGLGMSPKRITVSTAGISKMILKLADDKVKFNLALSLHAANDEKRNKIMPINESNTLDTLMESMIYFSEKTGTRPTLEYIIFKDFNDEISDAEELFQFGKSFPSKVNIIEYNSIDDGKYQQAERKKVDAFAAYLESKKVIVNIRRSRGKDIDAACGQLANKNDLSI
ncbi:23S rRNA (adenine(2503)-C(2))-methyltransferase RlmN [Flavobacteriales bacterium]|jgi:23S rRNA (adenine2503-C2)-methyltransferase|nr:23S rRNA (adenine(2503)-C(2))-methyltransferase RlmN [Flavobacteriales bacterium]MDA9894090.1 23S rRNA (adenine(2503)-C(2))-methyltransferase RlmN [bacterium]